MTAYERGVADERERCLEVCSKMQVVYRKRRDGLIRAGRDHLAEAGMVCAMWDLPGAICDEKPATCVRGRKR